MVLEVTVKCVGSMYQKEECVRVIEMEEDASLADLHEAIQDAVSFDRDHLYEFYFANTPHGRARERFVESDEWEDSEQAFAEVKLKDAKPQGRRKLFYLFDFGDDWIFEVKIPARQKPAEEGVQYPQVIKADGPNPEQYPMWEDG